MPLQLLDDCGQPLELLGMMRPLGQEQSTQAIEIGGEGITGAHRSESKAHHRACVAPRRTKKTLALLGGQICKSPEEYKAWSQNLGHENVLTTFSSYGDVARHRQAEIIRALGKSEQHACISSSSLIVPPAKGIFDGTTS